MRQQLRQNSTVIVMTLFSVQQVNEGHVLYILTSVWVLCTPNTGKNLLFMFFAQKTLKKEEEATKLGQNLAKKVFLGFNLTLIEGFVPRKKHVF